MSISEQITRLVNDKASIKEALINKGVEVNDESLDEYASLINNIEVAKPKILITSADYLFSGQIPEEAGQFFKIVKPTVMNHMYFGNDAEINIDMTNLDFEPNPNSINCNNMFYTCNQLLSVKLAAGIKAKSVMSMFQGCSKLNSIDLNGLDTDDCTDYRSFVNGTALTEFDGAKLPNLSVANNNCQNFFYSTKQMRKVWIPKEWQVTPTTAGYSPFISNGGSNAMNKDLMIFTDAVSEADQISNGKWSKFTMVYNSSGTTIPATQIRYGSTHADYESY